AGNPDLYVVSTEIVGTEGHAHVARPNAQNLGEWLRASHAIPVGYNRIVHVEGRDYVDGGVASPVPFDLPLGRDYEGPTVVILTRPMTTKQPAPNWWRQLFLRTAVPRRVSALCLKQHELHDALMKRLSLAKSTNQVIVVDPPPEMTLVRVT